MIKLTPSKSLELYRKWKEDMTVDLYRSVAAYIFSILIEDITTDQRKEAKYSFYVAMYGVELDG